MARTIALFGALLALALIAPAANANTGPVGRWQLNEGGGSVAVDSSGNGDSGTLLGGSSWTRGPSGAALTFDGVSGAVRVPDAPQLEPSAAVSVAAWVARTGSPGNYRYMVAKGGHGCVAASWGLYSGPNGGLQFYISRGHGTSYARTADAGPGVWDGQWHMAVGTFDGTTIRLYVDGAQVGSGTVYPGPIEYQLSDANELFVGDYPSCADKDFGGTISDVRIWNRALGATEVSSLGDTPPPPTGGGDPPSTAPQNRPPATGNSGGNGSTNNQPPPTVPMVRMVKLSKSTLTAGPGTVGSAPTIAYNDPGSALVTFTILQVRGKPALARCVKAARQRHHPVTGFCPRVLALGRFVHQDRPGRNTVRFPRKLTPPPGRYMLYVTPALHGKVGKTVVVPFRVVPRRGR